MEKLRVMHYINQFFAGMGGEEKANVGLSFRKEAVGPGRRLQDLFDKSARIIATAYCGDNYFAEHTDEVLSNISKTIKEEKVDVVVAGPAFSAGRYGFACTEVCHSISSSLNLPCISGMHPENPGVAGYKQYKDRMVFSFPTAGEVTGMEDGLSKIARFVSRLAAHSTIGSASEEGYIPRGFRVEEMVAKNGAERGIDMLLDKLAGRPFSTEILVESFEESPIAPRLSNLKGALIATGTTCGIVQMGNPDKLKVFHNTHWGKYAVGQFNSMKDVEWDVIHGGYNTESIHHNPNYGLPLDALRELEKEGVFGKVYPYFYSTPGVWATVADMQVVGREIAADMKAQGVGGALFVSS